MGIAHDFTVSAEAVTPVQMDELTPLGGNQYQTPDHFYEHTLLVFVNGLRVEEDNDDGFTVLNDYSFELKETYPANFRISCHYVKKEV